MRGRSAFVRSLVLMGTAVAGLVASHLLDYTILLPNHAARQLFLDQTGHAYFHTLAGLSVAAAFMAVAGSLALGFRRGRATAPSAKPRFDDLAWTLGTIQVLGFVGLELAERFLAHTPAHHFADPTISLGVVIQVASACLGAALLLLLDRAGAIIARRGGTPSRASRPVRAWPRPVSVPRAPGRFARPGLVRAPPFATA